MKFQTKIVYGNVVAAVTKMAIDDDETVKSDIFVIHIETLTSIFTVRGNLR